MNVTNIVLFLGSVVLMISNGLAFAEDAGQERGRPRFGMDGARPEPPEFAKLSEEQKATLRSAATHEARKALLESWGIKMPPRPPHGGRRGPPPADAAAADPSVAE